LASFVKSMLQAYSLPGLLGKIGPGREAGHIALGSVSDLILDGRLT